MENQFLNTIFYGTVAGAASLAGIYLLLAREAWAKRNTVYFISFSAGVVLAVAFTHLLPEALSKGVSNEWILSVVLFTLVAFYILEHAFAIHTCKEGDCEVHNMGTAAFVGILVHSLLDGVVIGTGFEVSSEVGMAAAFAVLLHEVPEGITITALLLHSGYSKRKTLAMGWAVALATPVGAVASFFLIRGASPEVVALLLALGAGTFIYVGASDLLPETHKKFSIANILLVLSGVILVYIIRYTIGGH